MEAKRKRVLIERIVWVKRPETGWSNHGQVEHRVMLVGGPNLRLLQKTKMTCG